MTKANSKPKPQNNNRYSGEANTDSKTEVDFRLEGPRKTCSFKGNRKLWKAFVSEIKAEGLSVCHVIEPYLLAYLTAKVDLSRTIRPLHIENLVVERAVKRVRRYAVEVEESMVEAEVLPRCGFCGKPVVVARFRHVSGVEKDACDWHANYLATHEKWERVEKNE